MQNKILIFSENQTILGNYLGKIEKFLVKKGLFDFSFLTCSDFSDFVSFCLEARKTSDFSIIVCENEKLDLLITKIKDEDDIVSLVKEQAVKIEKNTTFKKTLCLPIELEAEEFLKEFLPLKNSFCCSVFGKSFSYVDSVFKIFKEKYFLEYKIISESCFLHKVYFSQFVDENEISDKFGENVFSYADQSMSDCCMEVASKFDISLAVAENMTGGNVFAKLNNMEKHKKCLKASFNICGNNFENLQIDAQFLEENGEVSKNTAFVMAKNLFKITSCDVAVSITGFDCDAGRWFMAVGNKGQIHVFSSIFYGNRAQILQNVSDFVLFRLLCFLKENYENKYINRS